MLTQSGINAVYGTAQEFADRGIRLFPLPNTPLSELISQSLGFAAACSASNVETSCDFAGMLLQGSSSDGGNGQCAHDEIMEAAVRAVGQAINYNTQLAKNVVNPMIERVATAVSAGLERFTSDASVPVSISPVFDRNFWSTPYTTELFSRYGETVVDDVVYSGPAVPYSPGVLETQLESFDVAIREYVSQLDSDEGGQRVEFYWNNTFGKGAFSTREALSGGRESIDAAIITYLGAQALQGNPPADTEMSAVAWETMCNNIKAQAGRVAFYGLNKLERDRRMGRMVIEFPHDHTAGKKIFVDGPSYNNFLQAGGTPEAILGSFFSDRVTGSEQLLSKKEDYASFWKTTQSTLVSQAVSERLSVLIRTLEQAVAAEINNLSEEDLVVDRAELHSRLRSCLSTVGSRDIENIWAVASNTICHVIYPHTDVRQTLMAIDEQVRMRPDLDIREAALYAMIDQLAKWIAKLVGVEAVRV